MRTDRELLELAARAAGFESKWDQPRGSSFGRLRILVGDRWPTWHPLADDGESLRLAGALELDIMHRVVGGNRIEVLPPGGPLTVVRYKDDRMAAIRRAVVEAAASVAEKRVRSASPAPQVQEEGEKK